MNDATPSPNAPECVAVSASDCVAPLILSSVFYISVVTRLYSAFPKLHLLLPQNYMNNNFGQKLSKYRKAEIASQRYFFKRCEKCDEYRK